MQFSKSIRVLKNKKKLLSLNASVSKSFYSVKPNDLKCPHDYRILPNSHCYRTDNNADSANNKKHYGLLDLTELAQYPSLTAEDATQSSDRLDNAQMLAREYIQNSLWHPVYGYYSNSSVNYTSVIQKKNKPSIFDYSKLQNPSDANTFFSAWNQELGSNLRTQAQQKPVHKFEPYYGHALARYLLVNYKLTLFPYQDLTIYELGGDGTLMANVMDYIRDTQPDVYSRTRYKIINPYSTKGTNTKKNRLIPKHDHGNKVQIISTSILDWSARIPNPCFFIALDVFSTLGHDVIRYDIDTLQPYQASVVIDNNGDLHEVYSSELDPLADRLLQLRDAVGGVQRPVSRLGWHPLAQPYVLRKAKTVLNRGATCNLSDAEYLPSKYLQFCEVLRKYFPEHRLLASDISYLSNRRSSYSISSVFTPALAPSSTSCPGFAAPLVQTTLNKTPVSVNTYLVLPGNFEIKFPTDFETAAAMYRKVCNKVAKNESHEEFLEQWGDTDALQVLDEKGKKKAGSGGLEEYQNIEFLFS